MRSNTLEVELRRETWSVVLNRSMVTGFVDRSDTVEVPLGWKLVLGQRESEKVVTW